MCKKTLFWSSLFLMSFLLGISADFAFATFYPLYTCDRTAGVVCPASCGSGGYGSNPCIFGSGCNAAAGTLGTCTVWRGEDWWCSDSTTSGCPGGTCNGSIETCNCAPASAGCL